MRINKYLAKCGMGSRRKVEDIILAGDIKVNGSTVTDLAFLINEEEDTVFYRNKPVKPEGRLFYLILNKPKGYITTISDDLGRPIVMDLIPEKYRRAGVYPVGRLDRDTEGLLLLTNDGDLSYHLCSPKSEVEKEYTVELDRPLDAKDKAKIERGIFIHQLKLKTRRSKILPHPHSETHIQMIISEGKKRQIRYTFKNFGYTVKKLRRGRYGPLTIRGIKRGDFRELKSSELKKLKEL